MSCFSGEVRLQLCAGEQAAGKAWQKEGEGESWNEALEVEEQANSWR